MSDNAPIKSPVQILAFTRRAYRSRQPCHLLHIAHQACVKEACVVKIACVKQPCNHVPRAFKPELRPSACWRLMRRGQRKRRTATKRKLIRGRRILPKRLRAMIQPRQGVINPRGRVDVRNRRTRRARRYARRIDIDPDDRLSHRRGLAATRSR